MGEVSQRLVSVAQGALALGMTVTAFGVSVEENLDVEFFPRDLFARVPEARPAPLPEPPPQPKVPLSPAPNWDDRTPLEYAPEAFGLNDPHLPLKLAGVGPVFWSFSGQGTGALIAQDLVLTTGHLFADKGRWEGAPPGSRSAPPAKHGKIYLAACGRSYAFTMIELGSLSPRKHLGRDYAIAKLSEPACDAARPLPVAEISNAEAEDHEPQYNILLNLGAYRFEDLPRFKSHPFFTDDPSRNPYHVFVTRCRMTGTRATAGDAGLIITDGCDGVPGGSGGPLVLSRDGGKSFQIIGVANSYKPSDREYNNYTRITGVFARHLARFISTTSNHKETADVFR